MQSDDGGVNLPRPYGEGYEFDDGLEAIAVALAYDGLVIGCLTIAWIRQAASVEMITQEYLKSLQSTANEIIEAYQSSCLD